MREKVNKPRILCWVDSPTQCSGFGIVAKNLFRDLYKRYDVDILGINYDGLTKYDAEKYFIFPAASGKDDPYGYRTMAKILSKNTYDMIFMLQDIFIIDRAMVLIEKFAPNTPLIIYFPVDGAPFNLTWKRPLEKAHTIITYSQFAKQAILDTFPEFKDKEILLLDHGIDTSVFKPLGSKKIKKLQKEAGWHNKFVVCSNNRFQPRKNIGATMRAMLLFTHGYLVCDCCNWYASSKPRCDLNNCSKEHIVETVSGKKDSLLYLHMNAKDISMGTSPASSLQAMAVNAGYVDSDTIGKKAVLAIYNKDPYTEPMTEEGINEIYNMSAVNMSSATGEGFGFSLAEAQATGTPTIAPRNSAIPEVLGENDHLINNVAHFTMANDNNHVRPIVSIPGIIEALDFEYQRWLANGKRPVKSQESVDRANEKFNWDDKRAFIEKVIKDVLK